MISTDGYESCLITSWSLVEGEFELYSALETGGMVLVKLMVVWDTGG